MFFNKHSEIQETVAKGVALEQQLRATKAEVETLCCKHESLNNAHFNTLKDLKVFQRQCIRNPQKDVERRQAIDAERQRLIAARDDAWQVFREAWHTWARKRETLHEQQAELDQLKGHYDCLMKGFKGSKESYNQQKGQYHSWTNSQQQDNDQGRWKAGSEPEDTEMGEDQAGPGADRQPESEPEPEPQPLPPPPPPPAAAPAPAPAPTRYNTSQIMAWRALTEGCFKNYAAMDKFPLPPTISCNVHRRDPCSCSIKAAFETLPNLNLKKERFKWHPDKFSACKPENKDGFQKEAQKIFVVLEAMYEDDL